MEEAPATAASESFLTTLRPVENTVDSAGEGEAGVPSADVESTARDAGTNAIDGGACPESPEHPCPPLSRSAHRGVIRSVEEMLRRCVPLLPRGRKLCVLDLCSGSCSLMDADWWSVIQREIFSLWAGKKVFLGSGIARRLLTTRRARGCQPRWRVPRRVRIGSPGRCRRR